MRHVFKEDGTEAVLLVDASNAFNSLNRQAALHNSQYLCPSLATILLNTYHNDVCLFIDSRQLLSTEETTQGDPLAMAMYECHLCVAMHCVSVMLTRHGLQMMLQQVDL